MPNLPVEQRAGGIVYQKKDGLVKYLLVTSNSNKNRWIFPAGHVEEGETEVDAALREVMEEAGVEARVVKDLGSFQYYWYRDNKKFIIDTHLFLMEYIQTIQINPEGRQVNFYYFKDLLTLNIWEESRSFLEKAHQLIETA